jgi:hypothetical protein
MITRESAELATGVLALAMAAGPIEARQQAPVRVPRSVLERYVGEYDQDGNTIRVVLTGDTLFREIPGQRVALEPISETLFHLGPVFKAEFVTDEAGEVTLVFSDGVEIEYRLPRKGARPAPTWAHAPWGPAAAVAGRMMVEFVVDQAGVTQVMGSGFQQMLARLEKR